MIKQVNIMNKQTEITFMQTRLIRLASEEWNMSVENFVKTVVITCYA